jgi:homoserine dehydrogenase
VDCSTEETAWNQEMIRFRTFVEDVSQAQLNDLEKFADRILAKFGVDIEFTRHFADRMNDPRNKPAVKVQELQQLFKRIARNKAKNIRQNPDSQAVIKDMQNDLNLPIVINYDKNKDEFEVINKTIMRKKDFGTSNKVFKV